MLYRFEIQVSDIDRHFYDTLDFRVALHPSESLPYLLTRTLAYSLCYKPGLEFSPTGLSDPDAPALVLKDLQGSIRLWIEIGNPTLRKLHKASKASPDVIVYTYKNPSVLLTDLKNGNVHNSKNIKIFAFEAAFLDQLAYQLTKNNKWTLVLQNDRLDLTVGSTTLSTDVSNFRV